MILRTVLSIFLLFFMVSGCTPGIYKRLDSSAPAFGPIYPGITRQDAEKQLGPPSLTIRLDNTHYRNVYSYEIERSTTDILVTDIMDFTTCGLGNELVSPIDRFSGTTHQITITYYGADQDSSNDRVESISDSFNGKYSSIISRCLAGFLRQF